MKQIALIFAFLSVSTPATAMPISFTGAELASLPGASFPTGGQSVVGDGLRFDPTLTSAALYRLSLNQLDVDPSNIGISVNVDRLLRDDGIVDQDFFVGIYDGQNYFNAFFQDTVSQVIEAQSRIDRLNASEDQGVSNSFLGSGPFISSPVGSVAQLNVVVQATAVSTTIAHSVNQSGASAFSAPTALNVNGDLSLVILGDQLGENYFINSLTFTNGVSVPTAVPEPGALLGLALGLLMLGVGLYRRLSISSP